MKTTSLSEFGLAQEMYLGWCTTCEAFTRDSTEPDACEYDCPECGENTVYGAEEALLEGFLVIE